jgi:competence protein ComEC
MILGNKLFWFLNIFLALFLVIKGFISYISLDEKIASLNFQNYQIRSTYSGMVCRESGADYYKQTLVVCVPFPVLVYLPLYPEYNYGDFISLTGKLEAPLFLDDFNYPRYLATKHIYFIAYYPKVEKIVGNLSFLENLYADLLDFKRHCLKLINKGLLEPQASLANALILGYKEALFLEDKIIFRSLGISHLIVISGLHVTILTAILLFLFFYFNLSRHQALLATLLFLIFYLILIGPAAAATRASLMLGCVLIAYYYQRLPLSSRILFLVFNILLIFKPITIFSDIGFQLSFLAVLGILYIYPLSFLFFKKVRQSKKFLSRCFIFLFSAFSLTMSCQLAVLPILIINFKEVAPISLLVNPLVAWLLPFILGALFIGLIFSLLFPSLTVLCFFPANLLLTFFIRLINIFSFYIKDTVKINQFNHFSAFIYYIILLLVVYFVKKYFKKGRKKLKNNKNPTS